MKISKLILTVILALAISLSINGQSNSNHVISIQNDDESIHIEYEDGDVTMLKIDGITIPKSDYPSYQSLIDQHRKRSNSNHNTQHGKKPDNKLEAIFLEKTISYLAEYENLKKSNYEIKLTSKYIKLNGKKLSKERHKECKDLFENTTGNLLTKGSFFHAKISPGSRSIIVEIED